MKFIKKLQVTKEIEKVVENVNDCIYVSSVNGSITINGTDERQNIGGRNNSIKGRTFATIDSPLYLKFPDTKNEKIRVISKNGIICIQNFKSRELNINTTNGGVVLENSILDKLNLKSINGNITFKNIVVKDMSIEAVTGIIEMENILFSTGIIEIENSGSVFLENIGAGENLKITTTTGKVNGENVAAKMAVINTTCGKIQLTKSSFEDITIHSINGYIDAEIKEICSKKISSENGKVKIKTF